MRLTRARLQPSAHLSGGAKTTGSKAITAQVKEDVKGVKEGAKGALTNPLGK
jgi:hypothetical protein